MLAVVCTLWGDRYSEANVHALRSMAAAFIRTPHRFVCLSDRETIEGVETRPLQQISGERGGMANFSKLAAFDGGFQRSIGERIVFLDLDTVLLDDISEIVMGCGEFAIMEGTMTRDGARIAPYNGSMWVCDAGARDHFLSSFDPARIPEIDTIRMETGRIAVGSDQAWIALVSPNERTIGEAEGLHQYCAGREPERFDRARAVFFAGTVKPWDFSAGWLAEAYELHKRGGVPAWSGQPGRCMILGYGEMVWSDAHAAGGQFDAVIASPEAAEHRNAQGWAWGDIDAIGRTDEHCERIARIMGFAADQIVFCGRQPESEAA